MKWIIISVVVVCTLIVVYAVIRRRTRSRGLKPGAIMPYGELRKEFIKSAEKGGFASGSRKQQRARPPKDFRLPRTVWEPVSSFTEPFDANWSQVWDVITAVQDSISSEVDYLGGDSEACAQVGPGRRAVLLAWYVSMEVNNGGFDQYFLNSTGDTASLSPDSHRLLGDTAVASLVERANRVFLNGPPADRDQRIKEMEQLGEAAQEVWNALDDEYFKLSQETQFQFAYIKSHPDEFFRD